MYPIPVPCAQCATGNLCAEVAALIEQLKVESQAPKPDGWVPGELVDITAAQARRTAKALGLDATDMSLLAQQIGGAV